MAASDIWPCKINFRCLSTSPSIRAKAWFPTWPRSRSRLSSRPSRGTEWCTLPLLGKPVVVEADELKQQHPGSALSLFLYEHVHRTRFINMWPCVSSLCIYIGFHLKAACLLWINTLKHHANRHHTRQAQHRNRQHSLTHSLVLFSQFSSPKPDIYSSGEVKRRVRTKYSLHGAFKAWRRVWDAPLMFFWICFSQILNNYIINFKVSSLDGRKSPQERLLCAISWISTWQICLNLVPTCWPLNLFMSIKVAKALNSPGLSTALNLLQIVNSLSVSPDLLLVPFCVNEVCRVHTSVNI